MGVKLCAYCQEILTGKKSKEHIIPNALIKLFPEQNISRGDDKAYFDNFGLSIGDVCQNCNHDFLSKLDEYGVNLIKTYFLKPFKREDILKFKVDYNLLLRWLLKIAYNYEKIEKNNVNIF